MILSTHFKVLIVAVLFSAAVADAQMPPTKVVVGQAKMVDAPKTLTLVGSVGPFRASKVGAEIDGLVVQMPVREGDFVEAGGIICKLNDDVVRLQLASEEAELARLDARHAELVAGTRPQEVTRLLALYDEAVATFERWKFENDRIAKLYDERDSNEKEVIDTRTAFRAAERRKIAARASYELALEGERDEVIAQAYFEAAAQRAVVDQVKLELEKTTVKAPFGGFVVERSVEVGEWLLRGGQVAEVVDLRSVLVAVDVPEFALAFSREGDPVRVEVDAVKRFFDGKVKHVIRRADETARTFVVLIEVDNTDGLLAGGMFARVTVISGPAEKVVAVPRDAVVEKMGSVNVAMVMPGQDGGMTAMLTAVTVGVESEDWIAVTSGNIQPGMRVVVRGNENLMPFPMPIIIVDEKGTPIATTPSGGQEHGPQGEGDAGEGNAGEEHASGQGSGG